QQIRSPARHLERLARRLLVSRIGRLCWRHRRWLPVASFLLGVGSFFLVERQAALAQWVTALMLLIWVALLFEGLLGRLLAPVLGLRLPQHMLRFAAQMLHQET